jgi:hypothetical protein
VQVNQNTVKKIICLLFAIAMMVGTQSFAQQNPEKPDYFNQVEKYRKMKNTGAAVTVIGAVLIFSVPIIVYGNGDLQTAAVVTVVGIAGLGSGIPLYAVGKNNERTYKEKLQGLSVRFNTNYRSTGLTLSYRF